MNYQDRYRSYQDPENPNIKIYRKIKSPPALKEVLAAAKAISKAKEYIIPEQEKRAKKKAAMQELGRMARLSIGRALNGPIDAENLTRFLDKRLHVQYDYDKQKANAKKQIAAALAGKEVKKKEHNKIGLAELLFTGRLKEYEDELALLREEEEEEGEEETKAQKVPIVVESEEEEEEEEEDEEGVESLLKKIADLKEKKKKIEAELAKERKVELKVLPQPHEIPIKPIKPIIIKVKKPVKYGKKSTIIGNAYQFLRIINEVEVKGKIYSFPYIKTNKDDIRNKPFAYLDDLFITSHTNADLLDLKFIIDNLTADELNTYKIPKWKLICRYYIPAYANFPLDDKNSQDCLELLLRRGDIIASEEEDLSTQLAVKIIQTEKKSDKLQAAANALENQPSGLSGPSSTPSSLPSQVFQSIQNAASGFVSTILGQSGQSDDEKEKEYMENTRKKIEESNQLNGKHLASRIKIVHDLIINQNKTYKDESKKSYNKDLVLQHLYLVNQLEAYSSGIDAAHHTYIPYVIETLNYKELLDELAAKDRPIRNAFYNYCMRAIFNGQITITNILRECTIEGMLLYTNSNNRVEVDRLAEFLQKILSIENVSTISKILEYENNKYSDKLIELAKTNINIKKWVLDYGKLLAEINKRTHESVKSPSQGI